MVWNFSRLTGDRSGQVFGQRIQANRVVTKIKGLIKG
jgi:hypothetical protein